MKERRRLGKRRCNEDEVLIDISRGKRVEGYNVIQIGIDGRGKFKDILTPEKEVKRVYIFEEKKLDLFAFDRYNTLHNYRRPGDSVMLYYDTAKNRFLIIAVKEGDDLSKPPFEIEDSFVVTKEMLENPKLTFPKGLVPITKEVLEELREKGIIDEKTVHILYFNRNNPGFYL